MKHIRISTQLAVFILFAQIIAIAQVVEQSDSKEISLFNIFDSKAKSTGTVWEPKDIERYVTGLNELLETHSDALGALNTAYIQGYLPAYVEEMATSVITNKTPPSLFIDSFLLDFEGRLKQLIERGGVAVPDDITKEIIKAQINDCVFSCMAEVAETQFINTRDLEAIQEKVILQMYWYMNHPLRSEFKTLIEPTLQFKIANEIKVNVKSVNLSNEEEFASLSAKERMDKAYDKIFRELFIPIHVQWFISPRLVTSEESLRLYKEAFDSLHQPNQK